MIIDLEEYFWKQDLLDFKKYPNEEIRVVFEKTRSDKTCHLFDLTSLPSVKMRIEIKAYLNHSVHCEQFFNKGFRNKFFYTCRSVLEINYDTNIDSFISLSDKQLYDIRQRFNGTSISNIANVFRTLLAIIRFSYDSLKENETFDADRWYVFPHSIQYATTNGSISFAGISVEFKKVLKEFAVWITKSKKEEQLLGSFTVRYFYPLRILLQYISEFNINSIGSIRCKEYLSWLIQEDHYIPNNNNGVYIDLLILLQRYISDLYKTNYWERDYWNLNDFCFEETRINRVLKVSTFNFENFNFSEPDDLLQIKQYFWHLLSETSQSISTIRRKLCLASDYFKADSTPIKCLTRIRVFEIIHSQYPENTRKQGDILQFMLEFLKFCFEQHYIKSPVLYTKDRIKREIHHTNRIVEDSVIEKIFSVLDKFQVEFMLIYLIAYCTGLRISEILTLKYNFLFKNVNGFLLKSESTKSCKEQFSAIPFELYAMLDNYIKENSSDKNPFIFKSTSRSKKQISEPMSEAYVRDHFAFEFRKHDIRTENGEIYNIDIHAYRHYLGTEMHLKKISPFIIKRALHHNSIEMTMAYLDILESELESSYITLFNNKGKEIKLDKKEEKTILDFLTKEFRAQALPNGFCGLPVKLNKCDHANACLNCDCFITSVEYLPVLKQQLEDTEVILAVAYENNWEMQIATNEENKKNLIAIITSLKESVD